MGGTVGESCSPEQIAENEAYLTANGYDSIEDWGRDSDYVYVEQDDEWFFEGEYGSPVDLHVQLYYAREAEAEG